MVESNAIIHHRDEDGGTSSAHSPCPREIDQPVMPALERVQRVIGRDAGGRGGGGGRALRRIVWRLVEPHQVVGRHVRDVWIVAQRGEQRLSARGIRDAHSCGEDRRRHARHHGIGVKRGGETGADGARHGARGARRPERRRSHRRCAERRRPECHDQLVGGDGRPPRRSYLVGHPLEAARAERLER